MGVGGVGLGRRAQGKVTGDPGCMYAQVYTEGCSLNILNLFPCFEGRPESTGSHIPSHVQVRDRSYRLENWGDFFLLNNTGKKAPKQTLKES